MILYAFNRLPWSVWCSLTSWSSPAQLPHFSFRDLFIENCSNCCFLNMHWGFSLLHLFLWISIISRICAIQQTSRSYPLFLVPFSLTSLIHSWELLRDVIPSLLKSQRHFYCALLLLFTFQWSYMAWVLSWNLVILEYIFIINGEKANSVLANTIIRCKIVFCLVG